MVTEDIGKQLEEEKKRIIVKNERNKKRKEKIFFEVRMKKRMN